MHDRGATAVERFREIFDRAVADRLRSDSAGIWMSGGLDWSSVAASVQGVFRHRGIENGLHAYTDAFDNLIPDEERYYAGLVAQKLGIPITFFAGDDLPLFRSAGSSGARWPEPRHTPATGDWTAAVSTHTLSWKANLADQQISGFIFGACAEVIPAVHLAISDRRHLALTAEDSRCPTICQYRDRSRRFPVHPDGHRNRCTCKQMSPFL